MTSRIRMKTSLDELWRELAKKGERPVHQLVDDEHHLDFYAGLDPDGARLLVLLTRSEPPSLAKRFQAFEVTSHLRHDGRWALNVRLSKPEFTRIFAHLCEDLVEASRTGCAKSEAPRFVLERISRWERLLTRDRGGLLDEASLRGLLGELIFIEHCAIPAKGVEAAVQAWHGPLEADQDFHFADRLVEVKSTGGGSLRVTISSAEQLDVHDSVFYLSVVSIESTPDASAATFSLSGLVSRIKSLIREKGNVLSLFEERLALAGYANQKEYDERLFVLRDIHHFLVIDGFPRLRRSQMPAAIGTLRYELDLAHCTEFERKSCFDLP